MDELALLENYLIIGGVLFALGLIGFIVRRNMIVMFLCTEMMLQGVSVSLVAWGRFHNDWGGQSLVIFIIAVAGAEAAIALALISILAQRAQKLDIAWWQDLREEDQPAYVDVRVPEEDEPEWQWPSLAPAGVEPPRDWESETHRPRV